MTSSLAFKRLLLVVKHTPYEMYLQMKSQGKAPLALRWERLKHRHQVHKECVRDLSELLTSLEVNYTMVGREELDRWVACSHPKSHVALTCIEMCTAVDMNYMLCVTYHLTNRQHLKNADLVVAVGG